MSLFRWIKDAIIESLNQTWTLLGMFIAWVLLEGSARTIVGYAILSALGLWIVTLRVREPLEDEKDTETEES